MSPEELRLVSEAFALFGWGPPWSLDRLGEAPRAVWLRDVTARHKRRIDAFRAGGSCLRPMPAVVLAYRNESTINATATRYPVAGGPYFIAINAGMPALLLNAFNRLFSEPGVFPDIGDPSLEEAGLPPLATAPDGAALRLRAGDGFESLKPRCPHRHLAAQAFADIAMDVFIGHEFRHIQAGHVDYVRTAFGLQAISELEEEIPGYHITGQALEMDADWLGIKSGFRGARGVELEASLRSKIIAPSPVALLRNISRMSHVLWKLMGSGSEVEDLALRTHPSAAIRLLMMSVTIGKVARLQLAISPDDIDRISVEVLSEVEEAYAKVCGWDVRLDGGLQAVSVQGRAQISLIIDRWTGLWGDLSPYSYVSLDD